MSIVVVVVVVPVTRCV